MTRNGRRSRGAGRTARCTAALLAAALLAAPGSAHADAWESAGNGAAIAFDVLWLRPLNAAALALGGVFFAISAPFVWPSGGLETAYDVFVYAPYEYTILRPLGDF